MKKTVQRKYAKLIAKVGANKLIRLDNLRLLFLGGLFGNHLAPTPTPRSMK